MKNIIDTAKKDNLSGKHVSGDVLLKLLELDPDSDECEYLGLASRDIAKRYGNNARVGSSIGVDLRPCTMSCRFCSLGEEWNLIENEHELSDETVISLISDIVSKGYSQFTLRTTEFYSLDKLCDLARKIRKDVKGHYLLTANTGELTSEDALKLYEAGFNGVYHTLRLREGIDTPFDPETRISTMRAVSESPLMLSCGIDPIGIEHTNEEIVERLELFRTLNPVGVCTMRRINVRGTPMEGMEEVSDERMAQIAAVIRMASGGRWNVAVHPPIQKAMDWGANNIALETGANPRRDEHEVGVWRICDHQTAQAMFEKAGYDVGMTKDLRDVRN